MSLMNRVELKFLLAARNVPELINLISEEYCILEIDDHRVFPYSSTYLDTADYMLYNQHVRGELDRYKIRYRKYESTGLTYLEVKRRTNKGRTIKCRIEKISSDVAFDKRSERFITEHSPVSSGMIKPVLLNRFMRVTLAHLQHNERITIDFNMTFSDAGLTSELRLPYLAIVEYKKESYSDSLCFRSLMKKIRARPSSFSKYCIGSCLLNDSLKKNILKPKLLLLKKLENDYT